MFTKVNILFRDKFNKLSYFNKIIYDLMKFHGTYSVGIVV